MLPTSSSRNELSPSDDQAVRDLYQELLDRWNERDAAGMAALFADEGHSIGFDGSQLNGRPEIATVLGRIFADHPTATYVGIVRGARSLGGRVALLRGVAGMVPPGQSDLNPALNAVQTLVMARQGDRWRIEVFHNTPAAFHGRPELRDELTNELRDVLRALSGVR